MRLYNVVLECRHIRYLIFIGLIERSAESFLRCFLWATDWGSAGQNILLRNTKFVIVVTETLCLCSELLSTVSLFTPHSWNVNSNASEFAHIYFAISSLKFKTECWDNMDLREWGWGDRGWRKLHYEKLNDIRNVRFWQQWSLMELFVWFLMMPCVVAYYCFIGPWCVCLPDGSE